MASPYDKITAEDEIFNKTIELVNNHPLELEQIRELVLSSWSDVWSTVIGNDDVQIPLKEVDPPATVIGYFLEKVLAKKMSALYPEVWRGGVGSEKDLYCISDEACSIEMKTSGQLGF